MSVEGRYYCILSLIVTFEISKKKIYVYTEYAVYWSTPCGIQINTFHMCDMAVLKQFKSEKSNFSRVTDYLV